jgi:putative sigma-54 modulation protein
MTRKEKVLELDQGYNIQVTGRHVHVTDTMKAYAVEKISKLDRLAPRIIDVVVTMDIQKLQHKVDIVMKYGHAIFKSYGSTTDMYASVDEAVHKLEAQVKKYLSRIHDHHERGKEVSQAKETVYAPITIEDTEEEMIATLNTEIESETKRRRANEIALHEIVKTEMQSVKILTDAEAIIKMDFSSAPVLVFRGEADRKLKVLYRRADGNYGVIEPE